jgi:hypothetical protein
MPREQITTPERAEIYLDRDGYELQTDPGVTILADTKLYGGERLSIHWGPNGIIGESNVQLAIGLESDLVKARAATYDTETLVSFFTPALSRSEINHLIRSLRKARDQVHGRDE